MQPTCCCALSVVYEGDTPTQPLPVISLRLCIAFSRWKRALPMSGARSHAAMDTVAQQSAVQVANHRDAIAAGLAQELDLSDAKFRPVGGGKQAAYLSSDYIFAAGEQLHATAAHALRSRAGHAPVASMTPCVANSIMGFSNWSCEIKKLEVRRNDVNNCLQAHVRVEDVRAASFHSKLACRPTRHSPICDRPQVDYAVQVRCPTTTTIHPRTAAQCAVG